MQIAKVVPKVKTHSEGVFDYSIPPEILPMIKVGILVLVPFRGRKIEGIIVDIKKTSAIKNLKPIIAIIDNNPVIDHFHLKLAEWMADYYLTDFSKTLFENIAPPAKRTIKKQELFAENETKTISFLPRKYLVMADFKDRLKFYLKAIKKTLARGYQVLILVPDLSVIPFFTSFLELKKLSVLHSNLTKTNRWIEWDKIRRGEARIIIGSTSALFAPVKKLGLIILDQEENETYKNDQNPRFNTLKVCETLTKITHASLVIGSAAPSIETYFNAKKNNYLLKQKENIKTDITVINSAFERGIISEPLQEEISQNLEQGRKTLLVFNRKGEGSRTACTDCDWVHQCPQCGLPLVPLTTNVYCANCEKYFPQVTVCPDCHGVNLKNEGLTNSKIEKIIKKKWPQIRTVLIEKDRLFNQTEEWDLAIVTSFALKYSFPPLATVVILDADQSLNFPGFRTREKSFETFYKFLKMAPSGIIQTRLPESLFIRDLASLNYESFYQTEINERKNFLFPPFAKIVILKFRAASEEVVKTETDKVYHQLLSFNQETKSILAISPPSPSFITKKRGLFLYQIILKFEKETKMPTQLTDYFKQLTKGWAIDIDPFDIS